jgi:hypothetical protein
MTGLYHWSGSIKWKIVNSFNVIPVRSELCRRVNGIFNSLPITYFC